MVLNYALRNLPTLVEDRMLPSCNKSVCPVSKSLDVTLLSPFLLIGSSSSTAWVSMPSASSPIAFPFSGNDKTNVAESLLSWWCHTNNLRPVTTYKEEPRNGSSNQCPRIVFMPFFRWIQELKITQNHFAFFPLAFSAAQLQLRTGIQMLPKAKPAQVEQYGAPPLQTTCLMKALWMLQKWLTQA